MIIIINFEKDMFLSLFLDVYPYLRKLCRNLGLDFGTVDMRWGVKEEMTMEHGTTAMCLNEVER